MGCFIACFGSSKHRQDPSSQSHHQIHENCESYPPPPPAAAAISSIMIPISQSIGKSTEKQSDVKTFEKEEGVQKSSVESEEEKDKDKVKEGEKVMKEEIVNQRVTKISQESSTGEKNREIEESQTLSDSSMISYPPMHRYHNFTITDGDDKDLEDIIIINSNDVHEESSDSLFSLSIESRKPVNAIEMEEVSSPFTILVTPNKEINSIVFNQNHYYIHSVLNPVENFNQWKAVTSPTNPQSLNHHHREKENINLEQELNIPFCEEPSFKNSKQIVSNLRPKLQEIEVDTSLSSWLVGSEKTPMSKESSANSIGNLSSQSRNGNSCRCFEDRPILGALSAEEIKLLSAYSTPRTSPRSSRDEEVAIIGTVGSYWSHTGQTMDSGSSSSCKAKSGTPSKFKEDTVVKCNSPPFAMRLERNLNIGIA
ncbi:hypothetical protein LguiA_016589 [Lonicera macranthoides]